MQLTIFFVEIILIFFYMTWDESDRFLNNPKDSYSAYYSKDIIGNDILKFPINTSNIDKLNAIKSSELIDKMVKYSTDIEIMSEIFENGIEDNSQFKKDFIRYLESIHSDYIGGLITHKELNKLIENPQNIEDF